MIELRAYSKDQIILTPQQRPIPMDFLVISFTMCYWTILKYPQIGASSRGRNPSGSAGLNTGPSGERPERTSVGQERGDKFSGVVEVFSRKHALGSGDQSKHRTSEDVPSSKDVVSFFIESRHGMKAEG